MLLSFHTLDVFTDQRFAGNPLAVVAMTGVLPTHRMQALAREFNLSETVFVLAPSNPTHTARLRIFTPTMEVPFAGHPTIGAAILSAQLKNPGVTGAQDSLVIFEQTVGTVRVGVRLRPNEEAPFAEFDAPKLPQDGGTLAPIETVAAALGLIPSEIGFENHRPTRVAAGNAFACIPVASLDVLAKARPVASQWDAAFGEQDLVGAYLYSRQCVHTASGFHARMFAPKAGVPEDPATGSAAICLASAVLRFDRLPDGLHKRVIEQGFEMGRPSFVTLTLAVRQGQLDTVRIGGHAVRVSEGTVTV